MWVEIINYLINAKEFYVLKNVVMPLLCSKKESTMLNRKIGRSQIYYISGKETNMIKPKGSAEGLN